MAGIHYNSDLCSTAMCMECCGCEQYDKALEDFAEQFKAHCRKFTTKSISDADIDWVKNELKK